MRSKARLTITLAEDLLAEVDSMIDGQTIRNRSHAIETLIRRSLKPKVAQAVILAGGTKSENAALAEIGGQRLIFITLKHLAQFGIHSFVIAAGQNQTRLEELVGDGTRLGLTIRYIPEKRPLGTAGALKAAGEYLGDSPFLVFHGDVLTDIDIASFIRFYEQEGRLAIMAVKPRHSEPNFGRVMLQGNRITDFYDQGQNQGVSVVNTGVYLMSPKVMALIESDRMARLETDVFPRLARMGELSAYFFQGVWYDVSTPKNRSLAQARWAQK